MIQVRRRNLLITAAMLLASPAASVAQKETRRIGILGAASRTSATERVFGRLFDVLGQSGWVEGRNLVVDWRYANGNLAALDPLARELVALKPDVIFAPTQPAAQAAMRATKTIPIVFALVPEPVESGLAVSLARPGRNATGAATINSELVGKRLELLREAFPDTRRVALVYQREFDMNVRQAEQANRAAQRMGLDLLPVTVGAPDTYDAVFAELATIKPDALYVIENPGVYTNRREFVRRVNAARRIAMYGLQEFAVDGGLMSYSVNWPDQYGRGATYVVRILAGAKPADLPIEQPTRFDLIVNLKTAKTLGLTIRKSVLLRADRIIE